MKRTLAHIPRDSVIERSRADKGNLSRMAKFWDARAREEAYFFVDDREAYRATDFDRFWSRGEADLERILTALDLTIGPDDVVVEIGCGVGRLTRVLAARAREVIALDISDQMLTLAQDHHRDVENVRWLRSDGVSLRPLPDTSADGCISHVVFQHIPDPQITLGYVHEIGRVLRPGGWAALGVSNDPRVHEQGRGIKKLRELRGTLLGRAPRGRDDPSWLGSAVDLDALEVAASQAALDVELILNPGTQFCLVLARRAPSKRRPRGRPSLKRDQ